MGILYRSTARVAAPVQERLREPASYVFRHR
jgi:hypothetical protein